MATATLSLTPLADAEFEAVEDNVRLVKYGVRVVNRESDRLMRYFWKMTLLKYVFGLVTKKQEALIARLNGPDTQTISAEKLLVVAYHIDELARLNSDLLVTAAPRYREYRPWMEMLAEIRVQRDTLESLAESFRAAADPEHQALLVAALETMHA